MSDRIGSWIQVHSGGRFWPLDAWAEEVSVFDIAHALSNQCRFSGHCSSFYSVAQHSVMVSRECPPEHALWGLLHDAAEAYLVDLPRPIKHCVGMETYRWAEEGLMAVICERFGLAQEEPETVRAADERLLATEARDLMPNLNPEIWGIWIENTKPLRERIRPWSPTDAEHLFLAEFLHLCSKKDAEEVMAALQKQPAQLSLNHGRCC